jgi:hypothetical protein
MDRELTYQMPFERLVKLSRSAGRKAYTVSWVAPWLLLGLFIAAIVLLIVFDAPLQSWQASVWLPWFSAFAVLLIAYIAGIWALRRFSLRQMKVRADYESTVHMRKDAGGLRFAIDNVEYYLKWRGISQLLMEHDGVAVSHGSLFFLIPNGAFTDVRERNAFIGEVFARLGEEARDRSERYMRPVLAAAAAATGA